MIRITVEHNVRQYLAINRPNRLTQCCTQFKSPVVKILCVLYFHYNVAFTFKWYGNFWNKMFYSQTVWIGHNIELATKFGQKSVFTWRHGGHVGVPKQRKGRPCWCLQLLLRELNSILVQTFSFVLVEKHVNWTREWKHSVKINKKVKITLLKFGI